MDAAAQSIEKRNPLVSVIMSVYNGERFLKAAIDSILMQSYQNLELIIVDDNSNEATKEILSSIKDERVNIIYNVINLGLTKNLNAALDYCKGIYIARMDADDISLPQRLEKQVAFLEHYNHFAGTAGWTELVDENGEMKGTWEDDRKFNTPKELTGILPQKNVIAHPTVMLRANVLKKYKYNEQQKHSQDWDLWLRFFADGLLIEKMTEVVLQYRVHSSSVTSLHRDKTAFQKINETYTHYLWQVKTWNEFNKKVRANYRKNKLLMYLKSVKKIFIKSK